MLVQISCLPSMQLSTQSGQPRLLVSLRQLWTAVTTGPQSGRQDPVTGLNYFVADQPPASAVDACLHWVSAPQVVTSVTSDWHLYKNVIAVS